MKVAFIGPPGAGKGTQAQLLSRFANIPHISTGDLLRAELKAGLSDADAKETMNVGGLVSEDVIVNLLDRRMEEPDCLGGYILDGFPRTLEQAKLLITRNARLDYVIFLSIDYREAALRLSGRLFHLVSGRSYHLLNKRPRIPWQDDFTGEELVRRADDEPDSIMRRLEIYRSQTEPLLTYYRETKTVKLIQVEGGNSIDGVHENILSVLGMF